MSRIRGKNSEPELRLRRALHRAGFRYRLHKSNLPGSPDIVLPKYKAVVFVHGCFWHRHVNCAYCYTPKTRVDFWSNKFDQNVARDIRQIAALHSVGWRVGVVWECGLRSLVDLPRTASALQRWLKSKKPNFEIPNME